MFLFSMDFSGSAVIPVTMVLTCRGMHGQALLSAAGCFCNATLKPHGVKRSEEQGEPGPDARTAVCVRPGMCSEAAEMDVQQGGMDMDHGREMDVQQGGGMDAH